MPAEAAARFLLEAVIQGICYFTARFFLPLITFGHVSVEPAPRGTRLRMKWYGVHRTTAGKIVLDADLGMVLGLIFWAAIIATGVLIYVRM